MMIPFSMLNFTYWKIYYRTDSTTSRNYVNGDRDIFMSIFSADSLGIAAALRTRD